MSQQEPLVDGATTVDTDMSIVSDVPHTLKNGERVTCVDGILKVTLANGATISTRIDTNPNPFHAEYRKTISPLDRIDEIPTYKIVSLPDGTRVEDSDVFFPPELLFGRDHGESSNFTERDNKRQKEREVDDFFASLPLAPDDIAIALVSETSTETIVRSRPGRSDDVSSITTHTDELHIDQLRSPVPSSISSSSLSTFRRSRFPSRPRSAPSSPLQIDVIDDERGGDNIHDGDDDDDRGDGGGNGDGTENPVTSTGINEVIPKNSSSSTMKLRSKQRTRIKTKRKSKRDRLRLQSRSLTQSPVRPTPSPSVTVRSSSSSIPPTYTSASRTQSRLQSHLSTQTPSFTPATVKQILQQQSETALSQKALKTVPSPFTHVRKPSSVSVSSDLSMRTTGSSTDGSGSDGGHSSNSDSEKRSSKSFSSGNLDWITTSIEDQLIAENTVWLDEIDNNSERRTRNSKGQFVKSGGIVFANNVGLLTDENDDVYPRLNGNFSILSCSAAAAADAPSRKRKTASTHFQNDDPLGICDLSTYDDPIDSPGRICTNNNINGNEDCRGPSWSGKRFHNTPHMHAHLRPDRIALPCSGRCLESKVIISELTESIVNQCIQKLQDYNAEFLSRAVSLLDKRLLPFVRCST
jgi:hypothetical protein